MGETRRNPDLPQFCDACFTGEYPIALTDLHSEDRQQELSLLAQGNR
jgi:amidophosphoribosyltransferase